MTLTNESIQTSFVQFWGRILAAFIGSLAFMIACAYGWVFLYSLIIHPGEEAAYYEAYAQFASPVVAVVLSFPVFYTVGRTMRRFGERAAFAAYAVVVLNLLTDAMAISTVGLGNTHFIAMSVLAAMGKILGAWQGSRPAA